MIDARGRSCPLPVVMVQREMKEHDPDDGNTQVLYFQNAEATFREPLNKSRRTP